MRLEIQDSGQVFDVAEAIDALDAATRFACRQTIAWWREQGPSLVVLVGTGDVREIAITLDLELDVHDRTATPPPAPVARRAPIPIPADRITRSIRPPIALPEEDTDDPRRLLLDLLATIHRDGGQHTAAQGLEASVKEAIHAIAEVITTGEAVPYVTTAAGDPEEETDTDETLPAPSLR